LDTAIRSLSEAGARSVPAAHVPRGAVLVACIGSDIGKLALAGTDAVINQQLAGIVPRPPHDGLYLYYHLRALRPVLRAAAGGSAQPHLGRATLARLPIDLPPPAKQRAISRVLGALDDKIELNARLSAILTEIAATRFHQRFVAFDDYPERVDSELGPIPPGFRVVRLGELVTLDRGLSYRGDRLGAVGRPMIGLGEFTGRGLDAPRRYAGRHLARHLVAPGELLLAAGDLSQRRELLGTPLIVPDLASDAADPASPAPDDRRVLFSQHAYAVRLRATGPGWREFLYFALQQPAFRTRAAAFATGTTVLALPRDAVLNYALAIPPEPLRIEFAAFARPLLDRIELARRQSRDLAQLRDHILPGLIAGTREPPEIDHSPTDFSPDP
ncbi:MAG TPA: restriction endonuclease subunit S, partial [Nannocystis sp.]